MTVLRIQSAEAIEPYRLRLTLTDGQVIERDVEPLLRGPVFAPLLDDPALFSRVTAEEGTVVWPNGADLCPDVLIWGGAPPPAPAERPAALFAESTVEEGALHWLGGAGYRIAHGPDIAPGGPAQERSDYRQVLLEGRLRRALARFNPALPAEAVGQALARLSHVEGATLEARNRAMYRMLVDGVTVEYRRPDGSIAGAQARAVDFERPSANDWLAVNQLTVTEAGYTRRLDLALFVNGVPVAAIELKNAADEGATIWVAHRQLQTYQAQLPTLFTYNAALVVSDGIQARIGCLGAEREWFKPWRTVTGATVAGPGQPELQVLLEGVFEPGRFLSLIRHFIVFEDQGGGKLVKKMAGYHQFHAVNTSLEETLRASRLPETVSRVAEEHGGYLAHPMPGGLRGDRRVGVVWHTQGSGKSLTMAFYAGRVIMAPEMENPTLVVITDRNDLDDQLFGVFGRCSDLLRQEPVQAADRENLRRKLQVDSGGVVFTTIQKFLPAQGDRHPVLSTRRNVVVIADEAHRSQYDFIDGFAAHMRDALPNASYIGFTGTPIDRADASTRAVFGDYISVYDIRRAVEDGATVPIYYESRLAKLLLSEDQRPKIDTEFEEATESEEVSRKERLKSKWAQIEAIVGTPHRLRLIAEDLVAHFERRLDALEGKGMIVCMSRRICVGLYREIALLRPQWISQDDAAGALKIVMTGSASDPPDWQEHIRGKSRREELARRFRDPADPFKLVIVRDMWLTGFDAPSLHTMYIDKPMRGHGLMQAIARVNRVFRDKPGGLVVDYLGLAPELQQALVAYTESGGQGDAVVQEAEAVAVMLEKYEVCCNLFHGFDWKAWPRGASHERLSLLASAQERILAQENGKPRLLRCVTALSKAFALAATSEDALRIRDDVAFFQAVRSLLAKGVAEAATADEAMNHAIRQIVSRAVVPEGVVDIFTAAGLQKPDISILSDEFLVEVRDMPRKNLAVEMLRKLLTGEIRERSRTNVVQARLFSEMLERSLRRYQNRAVETAQVVEELIGLAKEMRAAQERGEQLGLTADELAFYDALDVNDTYVQVMGDEALRTIARELVTAVRSNVTIDWTVRENVRAQLRVVVKRILRKYGYPPDRQERATQTVLEQAEVLSAAWAGGE